MNYLCYILLVAFSPLVDSLLHVYDQELNQDAVYKQVREQQIAATEDTDALASLYWSYQCDSALKYLSHSNTKMAVIRSAYLLTSIGEYSHAIETVGQIQPQDLTNEERVWYYETLYHLYGEQAFYCKQASFSQANRIKEQQALDSLRHYIHVTGIRTNYRSSTYQEEAADVPLLKPKEDTHAFAGYAFQRALDCRDQQDIEGYQSWLIRSAIADVRTGTTDNGSAWMVAELLYDYGDISRAYKCITYSLNNANFYNGSLRKGQVAPLMNIISAKYELKKEQQQRYLAIALGLLIALSIGLAISINKLRKMNKQMGEINTQLHRANRIKEEYICQYLNVYSQCIYRMRKMNKNPEFMELEMDKFYEHFDATFLNIYPHFIEDFNRLLTPDARIELKKGELLNTELRIYALYRLGIHQSNKIAELLCYSQSTIYNYRTRLSAHALDKTTSLDEQVMQISVL